VNARDPRARPAGGRPAGGRERGAAAFERWLGDGLAPDERDAAAGRRLAEAWRDRRRALDGSTPGTAAAARRLRAWWWAPMAVAAVALVAVLAWPTPTVVDGAALAESYLEAMGALPTGTP